MKNLKKIVLSLVLSVVMCFPVFLAVGCGEKKNEEQERTTATVANDVARAYKDYIALLVKENNDLVKEGIDEGPTEDITPAQEARSNRLHEINSHINDLRNNMNESVYAAVEMRHTKANTWYIRGDETLMWTENENGYEAYSGHSDYNNEEGTLYEDVYTCSYIYEGNKLAQIELTNVSYTDYYQQFNHEVAEEVTIWTARGIENINKYVYDVKTNTEYMFNMWANVDQYATTYFNAVEDFIQKYSAGTIGLSDLDNYKFKIAVQTKDNRETDNTFKILKAFKKQNINFDNIKVRDVNIFDAEMYELTEEEQNARDAEMDALTEAEYTQLDNNFYVPVEVTNVDWQSTKATLAKLIEITEAYKEWRDNMPAETRSIHGPEGYTDFEYDVELGFDTEEAISLLEAGLASMDQDYIKNTWFYPETQNPNEEAPDLTRSIDFGYNPEPVEEAGSYDPKVNFNGMNMEYENGETKYVYTFNNGEYGYQLVVSFNENQEVTGFRFWINQAIF